MNPSNTLPRLIVLNGPRGVGKTSVATRLAARIGTAVCISGDALRRFAPDDSAHTRDMLGPGSTYRAGGTLAAAYLRMGAPTVIFEYVFETPSHIDRFRNAAAECASPLVITLWASAATLLARRERRAAPASLTDGFETSLNRMAANLARLGHTIHTDNRDVSDICDDVHAYLELVTNERS